MYWYLNVQQICCEQAHARLYGWQSGNYHPVSRSCQDSSAVVQAAEARKDGEIGGLVKSLRVHSDTITAMYDKMQQHGTLSENALQYLESTPCM